MGRRPGFTILELLLALLVISIVAAITIPAYFSQPSITLENASVLMAHDLRTAQNRSAYLAEPCRFQFLDEGEGYRVVDETGVLIENPATLEDFIRIYPEDGVFRGVKVLEVEAGGDRTIAYDESGRATEKARVTLEFEGEVRVLLVEKGSGRIKILGSSSGWVDNGY
jgi:prepilin-type N-terminal cleavage/methylation domain-containing protein